MYNLDHPESLHGLKAWSPGDDELGKWPDHDGSNLSND